MPRVFVAVNIAAPALADLVAPNERAPFHFTLRFLGEVPDGAVEELRQVVERSAATVERFSVELFGVGAFPTPSRPRVVWVGVREGRERLIALAQSLAKEFHSRGWPDEPRPFAPHLTVLRVNRENQVAEARRLLQVGKDRLFGTVPVEEVLLRESQFTREGAVHATIGSARLVEPATRSSGPAARPPSAATGRE